MDTCRKCSKQVSYTLTSKTGHKCKACVAEYNRAYREANKERIAQSKKMWKIANSDHVRAKDKAYSEQYPERRAAARQKWVLANPEKNRQAKQAYATRKIEIVRQRRENWELQNPGSKPTRNANRRAAKLVRSPKWADRDRIKAYYDVCAFFNEVNGYAKYHVDHIVPLKGKLVSGLHAHNNLQVIPAVDNLRKGARYG